MDAILQAYMGFPAQHRAKIHSTNPIEWLNHEIKRRSDVVGILPNEAAVEPPTTLQLSSGKHWCDVFLYFHGMAKVFESAC